MAEPDPPIAYYLPETVVLLITTHGQLFVTDDGEQDTFVLPPEIKRFNRISAVQTGVYNYVTQFETDAAFNEIRNILHKYNVEEAFHAITALTKKKIKTVNHRSIKDVTDFVRKSKRARTAAEDTDFQDAKTFIDRADYMFQVKELRSGDKVANKLFSLDLDEFAKSLRDKSYGDYGIHIMNVEGEPNILFEWAVRQPQTITLLTISMEQIVQFLVERGVANILVVDLSCSAVTYKSGVDIGARHTRRLRRGNVGGRKRGRRGQRRGRRAATERRRGAARSDACRRARRGGAPLL